MFDLPIPGARVTSRVLAIWRALDLAFQFLVISVLVTVMAMAVVGSWLSQRIVQSVTQSSALETALYIENLIGERFQTITGDLEFDPAIQADLERLVGSTPFGRRVVSFKVWLNGGRILYASVPSHVGKTYPPTDNLRRAWTGKVAFEYDDLHDAEDAVERRMNLPILEIYVPVRKRFGGDVVAVIEFYEDATRIANDIRNAKLESWLLLAMVGGIIVALLFGMIATASRTIAAQRKSLRDQISELSRLVTQNEALRKRVEAASRRTANLNERYLRRLGSDLHDGPAQLISLALLRLDADQRSVAPNVASGSAGLLAATENQTKIRAALTDALNDIRQLSSGFSVPETNRMTLTESIREAVRAHENRTGVRVSTGLGDLPDNVSSDVRITAYRIVQEGLANAARHAPASTVSVSTRKLVDGRVEVRISDSGPGFDPATLKHSDRLGILGIRERVECVGGSLEIETAIGKGTTLIARMPPGKDEKHEH